MTMHYKGGRDAKGRAMSVNQHVVFWGERIEIRVSVLPITSYTECTERERECVVGSFS